MKSFFVFSVLVCIGLANGQLQNLCADNVFEYTKLSGDNMTINSFFKLNLNFPLKPIGFYAVDESFDFQSKYWHLDEDLIGSLEEIRKFHNRNLILLYSDNYFHKSFENLDVYINLLQILDYQYRLAKDDVNKQKAISVVQVSIQNTLELYDHLKLFNQTYPSHKLISINKLINELNQLPEDSSMVFAFQGEPASSMFDKSREIIGENKFYFSKKDKKIFFDWDATGYINQQWYMPFFNENYDEADKSGCLSEDQLPGFFKTDKNFPEPTTPNY